MAITPKPRSYCFDGFALSGDSLNVKGMCCAPTTARAKKPPSFDSLWVNSLAARRT